MTRQKTSDSVFVDMDVDIERPTTTAASKPFNVNRQYVRYFFHQRVKDLTTAYYIMFCELDPTFVLEANEEKLATLIISYVSADLRNGLIEWTEKKFQTYRKNITFST